MTRERAVRLRAILEQAAQFLPDKECSEAPDFFPRLSGSEALVRVGTLINWRGVVKRAAVDLWDRMENNPDNAPSLWEDILYKEGFRIIPKTITVGTAFALGEYGWWDDSLYCSKLSANVHTPAQYPAGWEKQDKLV